MAKRKHKTGEGAFGGESVPVDPAVLRRHIYNADGSPKQLPPWDPAKWVDILRSAKKKARD